MPVFDEICKRSLKFLQTCLLHSRPPTTLIRSVAQFSLTEGRNSSPCGLNQVLLICLEKSTTTGRPKGNRAVAVGGRLGRQLTFRQLTTVMFLLLSSVATDWRWGGTHKFVFMRNTLLVITVKKWLKSVFICWSYSKNKSGVRFFGPPCITQCSGCSKDN